MDRSLEFLPLMRETEKEDISTPTSSSRTVCSLLKMSLIVHSSERITAEMGSLMMSHKQPLSSHQCREREEEVFCFLFPGKKPPQGHHEHWTFDCCTSSPTDSNRSLSLPWCYYRCSRYLICCGFFNHHRGWTAWYWHRNQISGLLCWRAPRDPIRCS